MLLRSYAGIFAYCDLWFLEIHSWNMRLLIECDIFLDVLTRSSSVPKKLDVLLLHLCYLITVTWFIEGYDFVDFSVLTGLYNRQPSSRIFSSPSTGTPSLSSHFLFFFSWLWTTAGYFLSLLFWGVLCECYALCSLWGLPYAPLVVFSQYFIWVIAGLSTLFPWWGWMAFHSKDIPRCDYLGCLRAGAVFITSC